MTIARTRVLLIAAAAAGAAALVAGAILLDLPPVGTDARTAVNAPGAIVATADAPVQSARIRWVPERVVEGTLLNIIVEGGDPAVKAAEGEFAGEPLHFHPHESGALAALTAAPLDSVGSLRLRVRVTHADGSTDDHELSVPVDSGNYRLEKLSVAPQFGRPQPPEVRQRIADEAARARAVSERSHDTPRMWEPPFVAPRDSRITSGFGHGRVFNGEVQSRHTGTDLAGAVGAPVHAPGRGIVALTGAFYLGGGVIYIDHGAGLVTAYLHLSEKNVQEGDVVERGQLIGRVGATGRVTGPHLHWIVRYGGHTVDATSLLELFRQASSAADRGTPPDADSLLPPLPGYTTDDDAEPGEVEASLDHGSFRYEEVRRRIVLDEQGFTSGAVTVVTFEPGSGAADGILDHMYGDAQRRSIRLEDEEMIRIETDPFAAIAWVGPGFVMTFERGQERSDDWLEDLVRSTVRAMDDDR